MLQPTPVREVELGAAGVRLDPDRTGVEALVETGQLSRQPQGEIAAATLSRTVVVAPPGTAHDARCLKRAGQPISGRLDIHRHELRRRLPSHSPREQAQAATWRRGSSCRPLDASLA